MKSAKLLFLTLFISVLACTFSSCKHEGKYDYSDITIVYSCTENLFDFFTPKVSIVNGDGSQREYVLSKEDFKYSDNFIYPEDMNKDAKFKVCYCNITETLKGIKGDYHATISYIPVGNWNIDDTNKFIGEGISGYYIDVFCDDNHSIRKKNVVLNINLSSLSETAVHNIAHKAIAFDLNYNIVDYDDMIDFDGNCTIDIESVENVTHP